MEMSQHQLSSQLEFRILGAIALCVMCTLLSYVCAAHVLKKKNNFIRLGSEIRINWEQHAFVAT